MYKANDKDKYMIAALTFLIVLIVGTIYLRSNAMTEIILEDDSNISINVETLPQEAVPTAPIEEKKITAYICGYVNKPGNITVIEGTRLGDVLELVGGVMEEADLNIVNLAHKLSDEEMVYIPKKGEIIDEKVNLVPGAGNGSIISQKPGKVNINTASLDELDTLPGVGPSTASKIMEYRKKIGRFSVIEDLMKVTGIGDKKYDSLKDFIIVE
jgi:competence protein ComEA